MSQELRLPCDDFLRGASCNGLASLTLLPEEKPTAESDVDVYLEVLRTEYRPEACATRYDNCFTISDLLEGIFDRFIDLVTDGSLSERKARSILSTVRYANLNAFLLRVASRINRNPEKY